MNKSNDINRNYQERIDRLFQALRIVPTDPIPPLQPAAVACDSEHTGMGIGMHRMDTISPSSAGRNIVIQGDLPILRL